MNYIIIINDILFSTSILLYLNTPYNNILLNLKINYILIIKTSFHTSSYINISKRI